jgi:hypothetical protein
VTFLNKMIGDAAAGDLFGASVAIDGNNAIVGAVGKNGTASDSGSASVFGRSGAS